MTDRAQALDHLAGFHEKVRGLQSEWRSLLQAKAPKRKKVHRKSKARLSRGLRMPEEAFVKRILKALVELGGSAHRDKVLAVVGREMKSVLNDYDRQRLPTPPVHEFLWRKTTNWCRYRMAREGLLKADSPRGVWEITSKGRRALSSLTSG